MSLVNWDIAKLSQVPETWDAPDHHAPGVRALFFENVPWQGRPTRVFAWMGLPYLRPGKTCPAMVLLHGGGGTAFSEWVRLWNRRGYAAIAIDQCGCIPETPDVKDGEVHARHAHGGPPGWDASFDAVEQKIEDQWTYHAVAAALRAHALLAAQPGVDADRIGVTGISWGGYLTSVVSGVDTALRCAIPVYGCGFLGDNSVWKDSIFPTKPKEKVQRWLELWDPSVYLPHARMPLCWVSGSNDFAYPLDSLQKSYSLPSGERTLCIRVEMPHSHADGWAPAEIGIYADSILGDGAPLPHLLRHGCADGLLWAEFDSARPIVSAEINYTRATGVWADRKYNRLPARLNTSTGRVEAPIPLDTSVCYLNVFDDRGCVSSTPHQVLPG
jgi:dienelactone hydrolase